VPRFYHIFETGLSAQSHKEHGRRASAISVKLLCRASVFTIQTMALSLLNGVRGIKIQHDQPDTVTTQVK